MIRIGRKGAAVGRIDLATMIVAVALAAMGDAHARMSTRPKGRSAGNLSLLISTT